MGDGFPNDYDSQVVVLTTPNLAKNEFISRWLKPFRLGVAKAEMACKSSYWLVVVPLYLFVECVESLYLKEECKIVQVCDHNQRVTNWTHET